jgi:predicted Fe-S protein YdhL (DUF1289 family)
MAVDSPCIRVCVIEPRSGYCRGCKRTLPEIAGWSRLDDGRKQVVLAQLETRSIPRD